MNTVLQQRHAEMKALDRANALCDLYESHRVPMKVWDELAELIEKQVPNRKIASALMRKFGWGNLFVIDCVEQQTHAINRQYR